jgi:hypothetical protein
MPLYALVDGHRERVSRDGPSRAECAECGWAMIACRGEKVPPYWRHATANPNCEAGRESKWHLSWKALALDGTQEIAVGNRRADVLAPGGYAVEFQASPMDASEVHSREADWSTQGGMVWIFKAISEMAEQRIVEAGEPMRVGRRTLRMGQSPLKWHRASWDGQMIGISWNRAPERVRSARATAFLDLGDDRLVFAGGWRAGSSPLTGYGWKVSKQPSFIVLMYG